MSKTQSIAHTPPSTVRPPISNVSPLLWLVVILASLGLYAFALWFGELNQDEGWYLYAGRLVSEGQHPFIDFASTQGPVMAYVYALAQPLVRLWGVAGGRLFTAILGIATALCAALLTQRITENRWKLDVENPPTSNLPPFTFPAPLLVFSLLGLNLYHVYFTTMVKTYSLAGLLVVLGFLALEKALRPDSSHVPPPTSHLSPSRSPLPLSAFSFPLSAFIPAFISAALFALAAGVRLSAGILLPTIWLVLLCQWLRGGRSRQGLAVLAGFLLGGSVVLLAIYVPFMIAAPKALAFGLLDYHSGRTVGALPTLLVYKVGFLIRLAGAYFPLLVLLVGCWMLDVGRWNFLPRRAHQPLPTPRSPQSTSLLLQLLSASLIMVTLVHLAAVFPYDDYQVFIMPLLAVAIAVKLSGIGCSCPPPTFHLPPTPNPEPGIRLPSFRFQLCFFAFSFIFILLAHSASSPLVQNWLLAKRDRIWWPLRSETSLQTLQRAANQMRNIRNAECGTRNAELRTLDAPPAAFPFQLSDLLLTQDTYLAVEAGMYVPPGMELGPFCYFPEMAREKAESCHVLNRAMLHELIMTSDAPVAAFSGYGFAIQSPEITQIPVDEQSELWRMLNSHYELSDVFATFGQADTGLRIFRKQ